MTKLLLDKLPLISRVRRNHALEHATMHVLEEQFYGLGMLGLSGLNGFWLLADLPTESVTDAALTALKRLKAGEEELAFHEHCGTNLASPLFLTALVCWVILTGGEGEIKLRRIPLAILIAVPFFLLSKPLGPWMQRNLTTSAMPEDMELAQVNTQRFMGRNIHHIVSRF